MKTVLSLTLGLMLGSQAQTRVGLVDSSGKILAVQAIAVASADWKQHRCALVASGTDRQARFFLQPLAAGSLDLDFVSLFPHKTFKNRPNGCRADLAQLLANLKPGFVRFPGGWVVEGAGRSERGTDSERRPPIPPHLPG